jgi:hypothetical protein
MNEPTEPQPTTAMRLSLMDSDTNPFKRKRQSSGRSKLEEFTMKS